MHPTTPPPPGNYQLMPYHRLSIPLDQLTREISTLIPGGVIHPAARADPAYASGDLAGVILAASPHKDRARTAHPQRFAVCDLAQREAYLIARKLGIPVWVAADRTVHRVDDLDDGNAVPTDLGMHVYLGAIAALVLHERLAGNELATARLARTLRVHVPGISRLAPRCGKEALGSAELAAPQGLILYTNGLSLSARVDHFSARHFVLDSAQTELLLWWWSLDHRTVPLWISSKYTGTYDAGNLRPYRYAMHDTDVLTLQAPPSAHPLAGSLRESVNTPSRRGRAAHNGAARQRAHVAGRLDTGASPSDSASLSGGMPLVEAHTASSQQLADTPPDFDEHEISLLTVGEVAEVMRVSKMTVYRMVHSGQLTALRVGRGFRVPARAVRTYLTQAYVCADDATS
jgi:excisionase family DNA binding protein